MKDAGEESRKSIIASMFTWLVLEVICFWVLPTFVPAIKFESVEFWLIPSIILGVGGSFVSGAASGGLTAAATTVRRGEQERARMISGALGFAGFLGVVFPFALSLFVFTQAVRNTDWDNLFDTSDQETLDQRFLD